MINHISCLNSVMLIEIPDPEMILSVGVAFGVGILGLFVWSKFRSVSASKPDKSEDSERLEYYERQLIDMKIRLDDSQPMEDFEQTSPEIEDIYFATINELDTGSES